MKYKDRYYNQLEAKGTTRKLCIECMLEKPIRQFGVNRVVYKLKTGLIKLYYYLRPQCKVCHNGVVRTRNKEYTKQLTIE